MHSDQKKILIVDDYPEMCKMLSEILKAKGYDVETAANGEAAINQINQHEYNVMILDYNLPGMNGLAVLKKANKIRPSLVTIMISGYFDESVKVKAKELGAFAFINKPFNEEQLVVAVKNALKG